MAERLLRSSFLPSPLSPGAHEKPGRLSSELLLPPELPCGIKERLHLRGHAPEPRREPKQYPICLNQFRSGNLGNRRVLRRSLHLLQDLRWKCLRDAVQDTFDTFDAVHPNLHPPRQALDVSVHGVEHDEDLELEVGRWPRNGFDELGAASAPLLSWNGSIRRDGGRTIGDHRRLPLLAWNTTSPFPHCALISRQ